MGEFSFTKSRFIRLLIKSWWKHKFLSLLVILFTLITVSCYVINIKIIQWMTSIMMCKNIVDMMNDLSTNKDKMKELLENLGIDNNDIKNFMEQLGNMTDESRKIALKNIIHEFFFDYVDYDGVINGTSYVYVYFLGLKMTLINWCYFMFINVSLIMGSTYLAYIFSGIISQKEENYLRNKIISRLLNQDIHFYSNYKIGTLISIAIADTEKIGTLLKNAPIVFIQVIFTTAGAIAVMLSIDWLLCAIILALLLCVLIIVVIILKTTRNATLRIEEFKHDINDEITEKLFTMRLVKSSATWEEEKKRYKILNNEVRHYGLKNLFIKEIATALLIGAIGSFVMSSIIFGVFLYSSNVQILLGKMTAFTTGVLIMTLPFLQLEQIVTSLTETELSVRNFEEIVNSKINITKVGGGKIYGYANYIEFNDVCFAFPSAPEEMYIKNFSLKVEKGKKYALVGKSGCGKSTIVKLVLRFYDPISGSININYNGRLKMFNSENWLKEENLYTNKSKKKVGKTKKGSFSITELSVKKSTNVKNYDLQEFKGASKMINLKELELSSWLERVGYVAQEPQILSGTFWENIRYTKSSITDLEVVEACKKAKLHDFIMSLPQKYNTVLAEQGSQLSGGQKQRLVIARMFAKNPEFLVLDEATSALDSVVEQQIQEQLDILMEGRTTISIAHRLNTIKNFDKIIVLEPKVGIVQEGTFNELIKKPGIFKNLYAHQQTEGEKDGK